MNAFTQKPDLSSFLKQTRVSENVAKLGRKARANPTKYQKLMFNESHGDMAKIHAAKEKKA